MYIYIYIYGIIKLKVTGRFGLCRGFRLCSSEALPDEILHLQTTFRRLRYPEHVINQALSKARYTFNSSHISVKPKPKYHLTVDYHPAL